MAASLILEDGTGVSNANSYISVADADIYFGNILSNADWVKITDPDLKARLLITASKLIDDCVNFNGYIAHDCQGLQWPRVWARNYDKFGGGIWPTMTGWWNAYPWAFVQANWNSRTIPNQLKDAVCEMARFLLAAQNDGNDRTGDAPGKGIDSFEVFEAVKVKFSKSDQQAIIPDSVMFKLDRFGSVKSSTAGNVRVIRT